MESWLVPLMLVYIVIVCIVFLALRDFGGRRFISTVLLLLLLLFPVFVIVLVEFPYFAMPDRPSSPLPHDTSLAQHISLRFKYLL